jgi:hypothetical protein
MECNTDNMSALKPQGNRDPIPEKSGCTEKEPPWPKNRANAVLRAVTELKPLQDSINTLIPTRMLTVYSGEVLQCN